MNTTVDVAIVGAGPYGLSVAAHLRGAGTTFRQFGLPMKLWRENMPRGMFLKSQGFASNLSDPDGSHTLAAFCRATGRPYADYGLPVPLDTFVAYGQWFQAERAPGLEETLVTNVAAKDGQFELSLANGDVAHACRVVLAIGVEHFAHMPEQLATLPKSVSTHSSAHTDLSFFHGQQVVVIGAGQSALESAALLHESGASVQLVTRRLTVNWNGPPLAADRPLLQRMREPEAGLGSGLSTWFYSRKPHLFRLLPEGTRIYRARTALGPAGGSWLRERVEGQFPIVGGQALEDARAGSGGVRLGLITSGGTRSELAADHVIAATGYRPDVRLMAFLDPRLAARLQTVAGTPAVGRDYQSSVPGLYVVGPAVAPTFGPAMRFVYGADHAAGTVGRRLAGTVGRKVHVTVAASR